MKEDSPELVNQGHYEEGWMIKLKMQAHVYLKNLLDADAYALLISS